MRRFTMYDTMSRAAREFAPLVPPRVGLYVCGLTPYAPAHVGHGRTFVVFDVIARALRRWGYRVFYVQNVTNLDDKLIARAAEENDDPLQLAERHFAGFLAAMERLGVRSLNYYPFATDYVPEILAQVRTLVERGYAYVAPDGSVYFEIAKFPSYGRLSGQKLEALEPGARVEVDARKRAPGDFVIWKAATPGEPSWESPWGPGRPGWHVEDTAMTGRLLGARYDLHGSGADLIFPHHEAEIALSESATGEAPMVNYWTHVAFVVLQGEKMSKSLGNVFALDGALDEVGPGALRLYYLNAHYRSPIDFVPAKSLAEAREAYQRLASVVTRIDELLVRDGPDRAGDDAPEEIAAASSELVDALDRTLANDFDTREAIARLFEWTRRLAESVRGLDHLSGEALEVLAAPYRWATEVLGLFESVGRPRSGAWEAAVPILIAARGRARTRGDFAEADRIRDELAKAGVQLEDDGSTTRWSFVDGNSSG
jgi:cysteinyl-tRNA synthetase